MGLVHFQGKCLIGTLIYDFLWNEIKEYNWTLTQFHKFCQLSFLVNSQCSSNVHSKLRTNILNIIHSSLVFNNVLKTLAQKQDLYIIYGMFLEESALVGCSSNIFVYVTTHFRMSRKHSTLTTT